MSVQNDYRERIIELVDPIVEFENMELVDVECRWMKRRWLVRVYIDSESGVTLDDCTAISNQVGDVLDIHNVPEGPYNLEISSPGLDRHLARDRDFIKFKGSKVKVRVHEVIDGKKNFRGTLVDYIQDGERRMLVVEEEGIRYCIPREIVSRANLEYEL